MLNVESLYSLINSTSTEAEIKSVLLEIIPEKLDALFIEKAVTLFQQTLKETTLSFLKTLGTDVLDCSGTGGSGLIHFNTSTTVAFVLAAAGVKVVKFGNRGVGSQSGSFDLLEALGIACHDNLNLFAEALYSTNLLFLFAPAIYPQFKELALVRRSISQPTFLNFIGPLLNPVCPAYRLMGVSNKQVQHTIAQYLVARSELKHALLVTAANGLDELYSQGSNYLTELKGGFFEEFLVDGTELFELQIHTEEFSVCFKHINEVSDCRDDKRVDNSKYDGAGQNFDLGKTLTAKDNLEIFRQILDGSDISSLFYKLVVLNSAAGLYVANKASSIKEATYIVQELLSSRLVLNTYEKCRRLYEGFSS